MNVIVLNLRIYYNMDAYFTLLSFPIEMLLNIVSSPFLESPTTLMPRNVFMMSLLRNGLKLHMRTSRTPCTVSEDENWAWKAN